MAGSVGGRRDFTAPRDRRVAHVRNSEQPSGTVQRVPGARGLLLRSARRANVPESRQDFYREHGPGDFARTYGISPQFKEKVADNLEFDVLLCAQNIPASIDIGPVTTARSARVGWTTVSTYWNGGSGKADFTAYVDLDATRPIQLLDVDCGSEG